MSIDKWPIYKEDERIRDVNDKYFYGEWVVPEDEDDLTEKEKILESDRL
jgi:hypothetical protein